MLIQGLEKRYFCKELLYSNHFAVQAIRFAEDLQLFTPPLKLEWILHLKGVKGV